MSLPEKTRTTHLHIASMCLFEDCSKPLPQSTFSTTTVIPHTQQFSQILVIIDSSVKYLPTSTSYTSYTIC